MEDSKDFIMKDIALYPQEDEEEAGDPSEIKHFLEQEQEFMVGLLIWSELGFFFQSHPSMKKTNKKNLFYCQL